MCLSRITSFFYAIFLAITYCASAAAFWLRSKWQSRPNKKRCLVIFSRYPTPGRTKSRLIPSVGERGAALIQLHMTENLLDKVEEAKRQDGSIHTELFYYGGEESDISYWLGKRQERMQLSWRPQGNGGLGQKLIHAFLSMFKEGSEYVVIVGSDIPGINTEVIEEAFDLLGSGKQLVLGKAEDGGYYLVGISKDCINHLGNIFRDIDWGTKKVFEQQMERANHLHLKSGVLSTVLSDVDTAEDLPVFERALGVSTAQLLEPRLTVMIPVYNEEKTIVKTLECVVQHARNKTRLDIIVCDGGSSDSTESAVKQFATQTSVPVQFVQSPPGRGFQLKHAGSLAKGDNLLFLHADSLLPESYDDTLQKCLEIPGNSAGAFRFDLDVFYPELWSEKTSWIFHLTMIGITKGTNLRSSRLELPYGDQGLFMARQTYNKVGGFDKVYLMEDYMMVEKLRNIGHVALAPGDPVITSARRWIAYGALRITFLNILIVQAYRWGVPPNTLAKWYYGDKLKKIQDKKTL